MKKSFSIALCLALAVQIVLLGTFMTSAAAPEVCKEFVFTDTFDNDIFFTPADDEIFTTEMPHWGPGSSQGNDGWDKATSPEVQSDGSLLFDQYDGMTLYWENIDGFELSADKVYTITFDAEILSKGDGTLIRPGGWNRELYFGFGGYYNQIEFNSNGKGIRAGDVVAELYPNGGWTDVKDYALDKYSVEVVFDPAANTVTSTVKLGDTVIRQGQRSGAQYAVTNAHAKLWTWRCEGGSFKLSNVVISDGTNDYEADFANDFVNKDELLAKTNWIVEGKDYGNKDSASIPTVENGLLKLDTRDSVTFNWKRLLAKNGLTYNSSVSYTFEFDARVTNSGTLVNGTWDSNAAHTGILYVALGGWFDQIRINTNQGKVYAGGSSTATYSEATYLNEWIHVSLVLNGANATSTITDANGNVLASGTRTNNDYTSTTSDHMLAIAIRCEDGAIDIDNFKFIVDDPSVSAPHNTETVGYVAADCGNTGYTGDSVCKVCGETITKGQTIAATGEHDYGDWDNGTAPNCKDTGVLGHYQCGTCLKYFDEDYAEIDSIVIPTNGEHSYNPDTDWIDEIPATCDENGTLGHYHCNSCDKDFDENGEELTDLAIEAGHTYGEWNDEIPATCTENGTVEHYFCDECDTYFDEDYEVIAEADLAIEAGHTCGEWNDEVPATCTENGTVGYYYCSVCEKYLDEEYEEIADITIAAGHKYGDIIPEIVPTCTEPGTIAHYQCSVCNKDFDADKTEVTDLLIAAKGHTYGDWVVTTEATVDAEGEKKRQCSECEDVETATIAKLDPPANDNNNDEANTDNANTDNSTEDNGADATEPAEGGCGSSIAATAVAMVIAAGLGVTVLKKKED